VHNEKLINLRVYKGYTRDEMANMLNISMFTYRSWEYGVNRPHDFQFLRLAELLDVPVSKLILECFPNLTDLIELVNVLKSEFENEFKHNEEIKRNLIEKRYEELAIAKENIKRV
jgi:transcriptional regulator with XRE-family HTH domain